MKTTNLTISVSGETLPELIENLSSTLEMLQGAPVDARKMRRRSETKTVSKKIASTPNGKAEKDEAQTEKSDTAQDTDEPERDISELRAAALDKLEAIFVMEKTDKDPQEAILNLMPKYGVESLREVADDRIAELLEDAEKLAAEFGLSN